jgi:hypothetical protein
MKNRIVFLFFSLFFIVGCSSSPSKKFDIGASWGRVSTCLARSVVELDDKRSDASVIADAAVSDCNSVISSEVSYAVSSNGFLDGNAIYRAMKSKAKNTATRYVLSSR